MTAATTTLILIRHGETAMNVEEDLPRPLDIPLNANAASIRPPGWPRRSGRCPWPPSTPAPWRAPRPPPRPWPPPTD